MIRPLGRLVVAFVVVTSLLTAPMVTVTASPDSTPTTAAVDGTVHGPVSQTTPTNNSTVPHENPDEADDSGSLTAVRDWLTGRIETALVDCARLATPTDNGTCATLRRTSEYRSLTSRYASVARATDGTRDDNVARVLNRTADHQLAFTRAVVRYRSTLAAYRAARRQGQVRRARVLARRALLQGGRVVTTGQRLSTDYAIISDNGTMAIDPARDVTAETTGNVSETADRIRSAELNPPVMNLSANATTVSFADPIRLRGQLRAADGTPVTDRSVTIRAPEKTLRAETDANGTFSATYRPTTAPVGNATIVAQYRPRNDSQYAGTEAQTTVSIRPASGTLEVTTTPSTVAFGDELTVRGAFRVDGRGAAGLPVAVRVGDVRLTTTVTNASGGFVVSGPMPAAVANGSTAVTVSLVPAEHVFVAEPATTPLEVESAKPQLVVGTERLGADTARVYGRLGVDGVPVPDATLQIRRDNESLAAVRLTETGSFERNVSLANVPADESIALTVVYRPPGGSLEPVSLRVAVRPVSQGLPEVPDIGPLSRWVAPLIRLDPLVLSVATLATLLVFLVASGAAYRHGGRLPVGGLRRRIGTVGELVGLGGGWGTGRNDGSQADTDQPAGGRSATDAGTGAIADVGVDSTFLNVARTRLDGDRPDDAVIAAYGAARRHLDDRLDIDPALTHWELLAVYHDALDDDSRDALRQLTAAYESAAFSPAGSTAETARAAYESAVRIVGHRSSWRDEAPADD